jgi:ankyrin repeat protein
MRTLSLILILLFLSAVYAEEKEKSTEKESLMVAVEEGNIHELKELIDKGANVNQVDEEEGVTPLIQACMFGRVDAVGALIHAGANIETPDSANGATPLMWAAIRDPGKEAREKGIPIPSLKAKNEIVRLLLKAGANAKAKDSWGGTPLLWAADEGNLEIAKMLLKAGADPNAGDGDGLTPLMASANYETTGHLQLMHVLLDAKASIHAQNKMGDTALFYAINNMGAENAQVLLKAGADVNHQNNLGYTPLMRAAQTARVEIIKVLIAAGADLNAKNKEGMSVLAVAERAGYKDAIDLLRSSGAK